ncbi:MAG: hypothetical protein ACPGPC_04435 [Alphaproteobacteria bacterium]
MPLHVVAWGLGGLGIAGLILFLREFRIGNFEFHHPLFLIPVFLVVIFLGVGVPTYQIYAWDEWTNWIGWIRQIVVTVSIFQREMWVATRGDTPGWALVMAFPGLISGRFITEEAWVVSIALHLGLVALFYDIIVRSLKRLEKVTGAIIVLAGWVSLLSLLALELSWTLVPSLLLIEEPQYYFLAAGFLAIAVGVIEK